MAVASWYLVFDSKSIATYETFSGKAEDFEAWIIGFEAEAEVRGFGNLVDHVRDNIGQDIGPMAGLGQPAREVGRSLYALFARRLRGKALTFVKLGEQGHGFKVLQSLYKEYRPHGIEPDHGMLTAVLNPRC